MHDTVKKMAMGSLAPDSTSRVAFTFSRNVMPWERNKKKTAAESVELIIATNKKAGTQPMSKIQWENGAMATAVNTTPKVANKIDGRLANR